MSAPIVLANADLVLPDRILRGQITLLDGRIDAITPGTDVPPGAIDCAGDLIAPGLIELHTDNLERHIEPRPGVDWPHTAAILAHDAELASIGITTVFDAMRVGSIHDGHNRYRKYARQLADEVLGLRAEGALRINHLIHLRAEICSDSLLDELAEFTPEDRIGIVSLMDHTPGQRQFADLETMRHYVTKKRGMSDADFDSHVENLRALQARNGAAHEAGAVSHAARLGAVLASHDDTTAQQAAASCAHGVTFAEFPTTLEAARACRDHGIAVMMGAPNLIRGASHSGNVAAGDLAHADLLDIVSSDYVPMALLSSVAVLGQMWSDLPRAFATVTTAPARATGLIDRGTLAPGLRADVIRVARVRGTLAPRGTWVGGRRVC